ncbi:MAG: outer membrane protein assembly factor BamE [Gammaproteobacteria bacterium]|nr:outer membrane protein assembly factor BamE [Gammaproteobacteria bacterium]
MQKILIHILVIGLLSGCAIYRAEVEQGNMVSEDMLQQVQPGMDKASVLRILGTPLVQDPFHHQRWDYYYSLKRDGRQIEQNRLTLYFESDRLTRIEGKAASK